MRDDLADPQWSGHVHVEGGSGFQLVLPEHHQLGGGPLGTITRGHGIGSVLSSAELSTAIPLHTQKASILVKSQARIFAPPAPPPPYQINFAKNRKNTELTQNGLKRQEIEKKIFSP